MESERLRITLDKTDNLYVAGETIVGEIWLNLAKRTKIRAIKVQITGKGKCKWMEIMRKNSNLDTKSLFYTGKQMYVRDQFSLPAFEPRGLELDPGEHRFDFNVPLRWNLPSTFKGNHGAIKYKLRILLQRPWMFDERHVIPVTVIKNMPLPPMYRLNPTPLEKQITKTISLFGNRPITMVALLPKHFAVRGEPMRICVSVTNCSNTTVEKLRFTVLQYVTYWSFLPIRWDKVEVATIATKETGAVHKKSERTFAHELVIPITAQPTDTARSEIINIAYELRVEAVLRGFFKNLILNFSFDLYSNYTETSIPIAARLSDCDNMIPGNPFENGTDSTTIYTPMDDSNSSPSGNNSESSSLHSTASESSAATLSPAAGGTALSYTSESSSQFNSPSARGSLYSATNVPYMPYSSSPMMINAGPLAFISTPSHPTEDSPQYTTLITQQSTIPQSLTVNLSGSNHTEASTSSSFLTIRPPPGEHELPPSYEELFGNAPEPPVETAK